MTEYMTELQERLDGEASDALRQELHQKMAAMEARLRYSLSTQLLTPPEFERLTLLARAAEVAQKVILRTQRKRWVNPD